MTDAIRDQNHVTVALGQSSTSSNTTLPFLIDSLTGRLLVNSASGSGDVVGPASATDNAVARFDGTTGKLLQNSVVIIADTTGNISGVQQLTLGVAGSATGKLLIKGTTSGTVTIQVADAAGTYTLTLPTDDGNSGQVLTTDGNGVLTWTTNGSGDVVGPASSTDNAVTRFDGTTGKLLQNSTLSLGDTGPLAPFTDDAVALGDTTHNFSDLFLATGAVINYANSNVVITHSSGILTMGTGEMRITTPGTNSASVVTVGGSQSLTGKTYNGLTVTTSSGTLTIANSKVVTISNTLTFTGTDGSSVAFGTGGTVLYTASTIPLTIGSTTITSGTTTRILYNNAGVLGEYTLSGSGTVVLMATAPTITTSVTVPLVIGGSGTTGTQLTLKTTTGVGTTDALVIVGGNNGGTTFATFSANVLSLGTAAAFTTGTIELGAASDTTIARVSAGVISVEGVTIPSISSTNTLTNKRMTRRLVTVNAPGATPTTNTDNTDVANFTGLATAITSMTTNLSGTPVDGDLIEFRFTDNATARAITWGASFVATTIALPTTTVISTMLRVGFEWNGSAWACIATA